MKWTVLLCSMLIGGAAAQVAGQCPGVRGARATERERVQASEKAGRANPAALEFLHWETSKALLAVEWRYPRAPAKKLDAPAALAHLLRSGGGKPLLVMRECAACRGTEQALLDARKNNDKTRLLCRWFHCVKLPSEVLEPTHPLSALFDHRSPPHVIICDADGSMRKDFDGRQTPGRLHAALIRLLRRRYEKHPKRALAELANHLAQLDKQDEELALLRERAQRELLKRNPDVKVQAAVEAKIKAGRRTREQLVAAAKSMFDLGLKKTTLAPAVASGARRAKVVTGGLGRVADDPYTSGGAKARMHRAGYVSLGGFPWSQEVEAVLPNVRFRWLETQHFLIGSSLGAVAMPTTSKNRRRVSQTLRSLKRRLPTVKPSTRTLDPWLRLHMYGEILEGIYREMRDGFGATDASFPTKGTRNVRDPGYMGQGPHLGMGGKYRILLTAKSSNLARYFRELRGAPPHEILHFYHAFRSADAKFYGACLELEREDADPAHALRCQVIFNAVQLMLHGYRHDDFLLPAWLRMGLGNAYVRAYDDAHYVLEAVRAGGERTPRSVQWEKTCYRLVKNDRAPPAAELCAIEKSATMDLNHYLCSWSRVEFLRGLRGGKPFAAFLEELSAPLSGYGFAEVLKRQTHAFESAFGMTFAEFDQAWAKFVLKRYRK